MFGDGWWRIGHGSSRWRILYGLWLSTGIAVNPPPPILSTAFLLYLGTARARSIRLSEVQESKFISKDSYFTYQLSRSRPVT